ncbi:MAG: hypothetical protein V3W37_05430 [Candidatus Binatia bacterium]
MAAEEPKPLTSEKARRKALEAFESNSIRLGLGHFSHRMRGWKISLSDLRWLAENGRWKAPLWSEKHKSWHYEVRGLTLNMRPVKFTCAFDGDVLTGITINRTRR